jgi:hypothetical protein
MTEEFLAENRQLFANNGVAYAHSILRDLERRSSVEGEHIVGSMHKRLGVHGLDDTVHRLYWMNLKAHAHCGGRPEGFQQSNTPLPSTARMRSFRSRALLYNLFTNYFGSTTCKPARHRPSNLFCMSRPYAFAM